MSRPTYTRRVAYPAKIPAKMAVLLVLIIGLVGCGGAAGPADPAAPAAPVPEPLPAAAELLTRSADAMAKIKTVALDVRADPALRTMPIRSATGKLTATGEAVGSAVLSEGGSPVEFQFVVTRGVLYLKGATGGYQALPLELAAGIYDPTALLRPDTGVATLLRTATGGVTEAVEDVDGTPAYRVRATLDQQVVSRVVPGISGATSGLVWIDKATSRTLKAQVDAPVNPPAEPGAPAGPTAPVVVTLSEFDAPVTVTAPGPS